MNEPSNSYSIPLVVNRERRVAELIVGVILLIGLIWYTISMMRDNLPGAWIMLIPAAVLAVMLLVQLAEYFARLHLVPQGIAITLLDKNIALFPAEKIGLLCGALHFVKYDTIPLIGVCMYTLDDLAAIREKQLHRNPYYRGNIPYRKRRSDWREKFAQEYLRRRCNHYGSDPRKDILWLEWDPSRLTLLQQMYPHAAWLDTTDKKEFDDQLRAHT